MLALYYVASAEAKVQSFELLNLIIALIIAIATKDPSYLIFTHYTVLYSSIGLY